MKSHTPFFAFTRKLIIFTLILVIISLIARYFLPANWRTPALPYLFPFFFSVNIIVYYILLRASEKKFSNFVAYYLAGTFLKLLLYIVVMVLYVFLHRTDALAFTLTFFVLYLFFTGFEVVSFLGNPVNRSSPGNP